MYHIILIVMETNKNYPPPSPFFFFFLDIQEDKEVLQVERPYKTAKFHTGNLQS